APGARWSVSTTNRSPINPDNASSLKDTPPRPPPPRGAHYRHSGGGSEGSGTRPDGPIFPAAPRRRGWYPRAEEAIDAEAPARILIVGGGYVGLYAALGLQRRLRPDEATITLVNPASFALYQPFLPEAASGSIEPRHVVVPLRPLLRR